MSASPIRKQTFRKLFKRNSGIIDSRKISVHERDKLTLFKQRATKTRELRDVLRFSDSIITFIEHCGGINVIRKSLWKSNNTEIWNQLQTCIFVWVLLMKALQTESNNNSWSLIFYEYMGKGNTVQWDSLTYKSIPLYYEFLNFIIDFLPHELYHCAEELCAYFKTHYIDPYGCVLSQKPIKKILEKCLKTVSDDIDSNLPFTSTELANDKKLSRKDNKLNKYRTLLSKIIQWSTLNPDSLIIAVKNTASLIRGINNVDVGNLVLVNNNNEWVYARVAAKPNEYSSILIYLTPDESQISTFGIDKVLPIPINIIEKYFHVDDIRRLKDCVENYFDAIYDNLTNICKEKAMEYLQDYNIDSRVLQLVSKSQYSLQHEKQLVLINSTLNKAIPKDKMLQIKQILADIISDNIKKLNNAQKYSLFPTTIEETIKQLETFNCESPFIEVCLQIKDSCKLGLVELTTIKANILSGKKKKEIVDGWLRNIKIRVNKFLCNFGYTRDALPSNYLDEMPENIKVVRNNQVIIHRIIESYRIGIDHFKLQELIDYLCLHTYAVVDEFIRNISYCISSYIDISIDDLPSDTEKLLSLVKSSKIDKNLEIKLENIIKDKQYLENMKRMEIDKEFAKEQYMVTVPISGLVVSELCRLENEHLTSLSVWEVGLIRKQKYLTYTPLENAIINNNLVELKQILSKENIYINESDECGLTPLHISCSFMNNNPRLSCISYLLDFSETNINAVDNSGNTAFHLFVRITVADTIRNKYRDIMCKFIRKSPNIIHIQNYLGETPLHQAILFSNLHAIRYLLEHNADPNFDNNLGNTSLHYAVNTGNIDCVSLLLKYYADNTRTNNLGESSIDIAFKLKYVKILQLLLETKWTENKKEKSNKQSQHRLTFTSQNKTRTFSEVLTNSVPNDILELTENIKNTTSPRLGKTRHHSMYWKQ